MFLPHVTLGTVRDFISLVSSFHHHGMNIFLFQDGISLGTRDVELITAYRVIILSRDDKVIFLLHLA